VVSTVAAQYRRCCSGFQSPCCMKTPSEHQLIGVRAVPRPFRAWWKRPDRGIESPRTSPDRCRRSTG
jgi:hypothetical protein